MSIDKCIVCGDYIDTDDYPEFYREDMDDKFICDGCYNESDDDLCANCNGSGEGQYDGTRCPVCKGSGTEQKESE